MNPIFIVFLVTLKILAVNCEGDQLKDNVCWRQSYGRGVGKLKCNEDDEKDALLCYPKCKPNYVGVGPVCWEKSCPSEKPYVCGLSCTSSVDICARLIAIQVLTPLLSLTVPFTKCTEPVN